MLPAPVRVVAIFAVAGRSSLIWNGFVSPSPKSTFTVTGLAAVAPRIPTDMLTGEPSDPRLDISTAFTSLPNSATVFTRKFSVRIG